MSDLSQVERTDDLVRQLSHEEDPDRIIRVFAGHDRQTLSRDGVVSLSRRGLAPPHYRVTRSNLWKQAVNPGQQPEKLPIFDRGILGELLYAGRPAIVDDLRIADDDPARVISTESTRWLALRRTITSRRSTWSSCCAASLPASSRRNWKRSC